MHKTQIDSESVADLIKPYAGRWVTLSADRATILGVSKKMEEALEQAQKKGEPRPLLIKVPDASTAAFMY